jgi:hypothetical protein
MKAFEIFRVGRHTAVDGTSITFSQADLAGAVAAYDPALHEAPLVVGHPAMDAPAYGWVASLALEGDRLVATPAQVDPQFGEMVEAGRFKKRSASFYAPNHPGNPTPGQWALKHVGFLGAAAPAVKGLRPVAFGATEEGTLEFVDWQGLAIGRLLSGLRDFFIGQFGQDKADAVLPADVIDSLKFDAAQPDPDPVDPAPIPSYVEHPDMTTPTAAEIVALQAELTKQREQLVAEQTAFAEQQKTARRAGIKIFVDGVVQAGRFPSGEAAGLIAFMEGLPDGNATIEFAEPGGKTAKMAPQTYLMQLLNRLPNLVEFGEVARPDNTVSFAETEGGITALSRKYIAEQRALGVDISPAEAVSHVTRSRR